MPEIGAFINQATQIGVETTEGVVVPAIRRLGAIGTNMSPSMNVGKQRARGSKFASGHPINQEWSEGDVEGSAAYNEMAYPLASIYSKPVITSLLGTFQATTPMTAGQAIVEGTMILVVTSPGTTGASAPTPPAVGDTVVNGTVTFLNVGLAAGQALSQMIFETQTFAKDDIQTYTIESVDTQRDRAARIVGAAFTEFTLESTRSDEMTVGGTVMGRLLTRGVVPTSEGLIADQPVFATPSHVNVYIDDSAANLGTTKVLGNFGYNYSFSDRFSQAWTHDRANPSFAQFLESEPSLTLELTMADDEVSDSILADAKAGDRAFCRFEALGPEVWRNSGVRYSAVIDMCVQVSDSPENDDADDAYVITIPMEVEHDEAWGRASRCILTNKAAAL